MPARTRQLAVALIFGIGLVLAPGAALADHRDFPGKVREVLKDRVTVENRAGDRRSFVRGKKTKVRGSRSKWEGMRPGDEVIVDWHLEDRPSRARRIKVIERGRR